MVKVRDSGGATRGWIVSPGEARARGAEIAATVLHCERREQAARTRVDRKAAPDFVVEFRRGWDVALRQTTAERRLVIKDFGGHLRIHATDRYGVGATPQLDSLLFDRAYAEGYGFARQVLKQESDTQRRRQQKDARKRREVKRNATEVEKAELALALSTCDSIPLSLRRNIRVQIERGRLRQEIGMNSLSLVWKRKRGYPVAFTVPRTSTIRQGLWALFRMMAEQARFHDDYREVK